MFHLHLFTIRQIKLTHRAPQSPPPRPPYEVTYRLQAAQADAKASLRNQPKAQMKSLVDRLNLKEALSDESTVENLRMAGYRGSAPLYYFLVARIALPVGIFAFTVAYAFLVLPDDFPALSKLCFCLGLAASALSCRTSI